MPGDFAPLYFVRPGHILRVQVVVGPGLPFFLSIVLRTLCVYITQSEPSSLGVGLIPPALVRAAFSTV
jgi:hypothetical protein